MVKQETETARVAINILDTDVGIQVFFCNVIQQAPEITHSTLILYPATEILGYPDLPGCFNALCRCSFTSRLDRMLHHLAK
jgi:hypothetical protein